MEDSLSKYMRLSARIFLCFVGFFVALFLVMFALRFFFGILDRMSWLSTFYMMLIVLFPALVFVTAFTLFAVRTRNHESRSIRVISYCLFFLILTSWFIILYRDLLTFFTKYYNTIEHYYSYNLLFLTINVVMIFLVGIIQALGSPKESDWMNKHSEMP